MRRRLILPPEDREQPGGRHRRLRDEDRTPVEQLRQDTAERRAERRAERAGERPRLGRSQRQGARQQ
jgi:hypothetical protein